MLRVPYLPLSLDLGRHQVVLESWEEAPPREGYPPAWQFVFRRSEVPFRSYRHTVRATANSPTCKAVAVLRELGFSVDLPSARHKLQITHQDAEDLIGRPVVLEVEEPR